jgi:hypothetical protein
MLLCISGQQAQFRPVVAMTDKHNCKIFLDPHVCYFIRSSAKLKETMPSVGRGLHKCVGASGGGSSNSALTHTVFFKSAGPTHRSPQHNSYEVYFSPTALIFRPTDLLLALRFAFSEGNSVAGATIRHGLDGSWLEPPWGQ